MVIRFFNEAKDIFARIVNSAYSIYFIQVVIYLQERVFGKGESPFCLSEWKTLVLILIYFLLFFFFFIYFFLLESYRCGIERANQIVTKTTLVVSLASYLVGKQRL